MTTLPYAARRTATGCMLLLYHGGRRRRQHWCQDRADSIATQRRFRRQVHVGGKR